MRPQLQCLHATDFVESCWTRLKTSCAACERRDRLTPGLNLAKLDLYQRHCVLTKWKKTYFDVTFFAFKWIEQPALWNLQCWGFISAQCGLHLNSGNSWKLILRPNWFNGVDWYYFERIAFLEKNNKLIQPLLAQPSSIQHQQQQPQRPHNFLPFLRPQNSIQTKKCERKLKEVNQCQASTRRQQVSTPVLGVLCRSLYIDKANSIGTISSRTG